MNLKFAGEVYYWRGPAPFYFVDVPVEQGKKIKAESSRLTYGWGVIPCAVKIGKVEFTTALFPHNGTYAVPLKVDVRKKLDIDVDDTVSVTMTLG